MKESLSSYIDSFLTMATVEKGLSKNTIEAYSHDLSGLSEFLISQGVRSWTDVKSFHLRSYVAWLRKRGLNTSSIARHVVTVRRFNKFLQSEGLLSENPLPALYLKAAPRKLPQTLSGEDIRNLLNRPDTSLYLSPGKPKTPKPFSGSKKKIPKYTIYHLLFHPAWVDGTVRTVETDRKQF